MCGGWAAASVHSFTTLRNRRAACRLDRPLHYPQLYCRVPLDLPFIDLLTLHGLVTALSILIYAASSRAMQQRRNPTAAIAWILFMLLVPYLALPAFITFGSRKLMARRAIPQPEPLAHGTGAWAVDTLLALGQPAPARYSQLHVHADGNASRGALLAMLAEAQHSIEVCTFMLGRDRLGAAIIGALAEKARSGVRVRLLVDGLGALMSGHPDLRGLDSAGVAHALFAPPLRSVLRGGRSNLRQHRKLAIVDAGQPGQQLWCGGRNLTSEYFEDAPGAVPWRDLTFDLRGELVAQASALFERDWAFATGQPLAAQAPAGPLPDVLNGAQMVASGPDQPDDPIYAFLVSAMYHARRRVVLATPYFVPDAALLAAIALAARRGVVVEVLLPEKSNHRLSDLVRNRAVHAIAKAGARVWLSPDMTHGKLAVFDDELALAGSANLDSRSLFLNYELMVAFHHPADAQRFTQWFEAERRNARLCSPKQPGLLRDLADGLLLWLTFQL
jgi:cardiolipin synthase